MKNLLLFSLLVIGVSAFSQNKINQLDDNGERHGLWKKTYDGQDQLRYQGAFEHGKETGAFKYYKPGYGSQPSAILNYGDNTDLVDAKYFSKSGKLISKGQLKDRKRIGVWEYYHSNSDAVMMTETYKNDKLSGKKTTHYDTGQVNEEMTYENGKKQGHAFFYSEKDVLLHELKYDNDELHGKATYFNTKGQKTIEGQYKRGRKDGVWRYYEDGKLTTEKTFPIDFTDADAVKG